MPSQPWPRRLMPDRARPWSGDPPPRHLTSYYDRLRQALRRPLEPGQYCSIDYQAELDKHAILLSISGKGNCHDNARVETFFKTLKSEIVWRTVFDTRQDAHQAIGGCIDGLQSRPAPFRPRLHKPGSVRKTCRQMSQCLSTKAGQVQRWPASATSRVGTIRCGCIRAWDTARQ